MKVGDLVTREVVGSGGKKLRLYALVMGFSECRRKCDIFVAGDDRFGRWLVRKCEVVEKNFE